jgi:DNA-binding NtrC family response regulator
MKLLIIEDESSVAERLASAFEDGDYQIKIADTLKGAENLVNSFWPDFIVLDANFPTSDIHNDPEFNADSFLDILTKVKGERPSPNVILISGENTSALHFVAIRDWLNTDRVSDVLPKSGAWTFMQALLRHRVELLRSYRFPLLRDGDDEDQAWLRRNGIVSRDPALLQIARDVRKLVRKTGNQWTVLITGPNGSGKGLIARAIHNEMGLHLRRSLPFLVCNCGQMQPTYAATILFGSRRGIYTDALDREGYLEQAKNGVLFLDDVHLLPPEVQGALLNALQDRCFRRLGDSEDKPLQARVVVATNAKLEELIAQGRMSEEFLNRISRLRLTVPPLAERRGDIAALVKQFAANATNEAPPNFHPAVIRAFENYSWPGNVRQLENVIAQICLSDHNGTVSMRHLEGLHLDHAGRPIDWSRPRAAASSAPATDGDYLLSRFGWAGGWRGLGDDQQELVLGWLRRVFENNEEPLHQLNERLASQTKPKPIHFLKALLFVAIKDGNKASHSELEQVLDLGWDYTNRVARFLAGLECDKIPGFKPAFLRRTSVGPRYMYSLKEEFLASRQKSSATPAAVENQL